MKSLKQDTQSLVRKFGQDNNHYLQKGYPEAQVCIDFLSPFFAALDRVIENKALKPSSDRDVIIGELHGARSIMFDFSNISQRQAKRIQVSGERR